MANKHQSPKSPIVAESWCHTNVMSKKFSFKWVINHWSDWRKKPGLFLESSPFPKDAFDSQVWRLVMYPEGDNDENRDNVSLYLKLTSSNKTEVCAEASFSILNARSEETQVRKFESPITFSKGIQRGFPDFVLRSFLLDKANALLPNDRLTLFCKVMVVDSVEISGQNCAASHYDVPERQLSDDFSNLFVSQRLCDVVLVSDDGQKFAAHKVVLAARSPVFAAMFEHDMKEKEQNKVEIKDMESRVLEGMLRCIYTGKASDVVTMSEELLVAAERYAMDSLKLLCEEQISSNLTTDRASEILILADEYRADHLKEIAIRFIQTAAADVTMTEGWKFLVETRPKLIADVFPDKGTLKLLFSQLLR